jgi:DNA-binding LytR/AlgR family response regulator
VDGSQISVRDTIENVLKTLGGDFMKSHRAVIINTAYVVAVSDSLVKFSNGEVAACSYRLKNEVIKRCLK